MSRSAFFPNQITCFPDDQHRSNTLGCVPIFGAKTKRSGYKVERRPARMTSKDGTAVTRKEPSLKRMTTNPNCMICTPQRIVPVNLAGTGTLKTSRCEFLLLLMAKLPRPRSTGTSKMVGCSHIPPPSGLTLNQPTFLANLVIRNTWGWQRTYLRRGMNSASAGSTTHTRALGLKDVGCKRGRTRMRSR